MLFDLKAEARQPNGGCNRGYTVVALIASIDRREWR
jgi:hypothetical protein